MTLYSLIQHTARVLVGLAALIVLALICGALSTLP